MQTGIWNGLACSLWLCQALAVLKLRHLGHHFMKPGDFADITISKVLQFFKVQGWWMHELRVCTKDWKRSRYKGHCSTHPNALYSNLHKLTWYLLRWDTLWHINYMCIQLIQKEATQFLWNGENICTFLQFVTSLARQEINHPSWYCPVGKLSTLTNACIYTQTTVLVSERAFGLIFVALIL